MMFDRFLLLAPVLLLPLLLVFAFAGCTGTITGSSSRITFVLRQSSLVQVPGVTRVFFQWGVEDNGSSTEPPYVYVEAFTVKPGDSGDQIREFQYLIENPEPGLWTVTCLPYSSTIGFDEASCGPFELTFPETSVEFEIVADPQVGGRVQVSSGGCPNTAEL